MTPMTDEQFVAAFESTDLPDDQFTHAGHVRVAWWYLLNSPLPVAIQRFADALRRFATSKGVAGKYHETITVAFMLIIAERLHDARHLSWPEFAAANPDLFDRPSVLARYYREETLASDRARQGFVMPDR